MNNEEFQTVRASSNLDSIVWKPPNLSPYEIQYLILLRNLWLYCLRKLPMLSVIDAFVYAPIEISFVVIYQSRDSWRPLGSRRVWQEGVYPGKLKQAEQGGIRFREKS
jgi:hypothetical protein